MRMLSNWRRWIVILLFGIFGPTIQESIRKSNSVENPHGISGWLVIVALWLFPYPILLIAQFLVYELPFLTDSTLKAQINPASPTYNSSLSAMIHCDITIITFEFAASMVAIYLFFSKKRSFPKFYIVLLAIYPIMLLIVAFYTKLFIPSLTLTQIFDSMLAVLVFSIVQAMILSAYILRSRRVKLTFIN
jgi:hypothetical protein